MSGNNKVDLQEVLVIYCIYLQLVIKKALAYQAKA
jgi:hypothetical protein